MDRDTQKMAMKCSAMKVNGKWIDVFKDPITDSVKKSKKGRLDLVRDDFSGEYRTAREIDIRIEELSQLRPVFENGKILKEYTFAEVRANSEK